MRRAALAALGALAAAAAAGPAAAQPAREPTVEYTVQAGDTCVGIAQRELGDRDGYLAIHRLNPRLGPLPHVLRAGQKLRLPLPAAPAPAWRPGIPRHVAALVGPEVAGGGTIRAAWHPVPAAEGYRLDVHRAGGGSVLSADLRGGAAEVELRGVPPGGYVLTLAARVGPRSGAPSEPLAITVAAVTAAVPGLPPAAKVLPDAAAPLAAPAAPDAPAPPPPRLAVGAAVGDAEMLCEVNGRDGAPLVLVSPGRAALLCTTAAGVMLEPLELEVAAVTAEAYGDGGPLTMVRGERAQLEVSLRSAAALGDRWRVDAGPGLTVGAIETAEPASGLGKPAVLRVDVTAAATAPDASRLTIRDALTGARVAVAEVALRDRTPPPVGDRPRPRPGGVAARPRPALTAGVYGGWTSFPRGRVEGSELGDPALDDYQVASGGGAGMRAAWWRRDLFVEADVVLVPTGFVAADEPAWIAGAHVVAGLAAPLGPRYGLRGMLGVGGYALLGDAAYARADLDADITYGVSGTLRLTRDLALRLDGRHHIAPDRGAGGVTDVLEATLGIEAIVYSAP